MIVSSVTAGKTDRMLCEGVSHGSVEAVATVRLRWRQRVMEDRLKIYECGMLCCARCLAVRLARASYPSDAPGWLFSDVDELSMWPVR